MPGHVDVHALLVAAKLVVDGADDGQFLGMFGHFRQVFAKSHTRCRSRNVAKWTPNVSRGIRLGIKRLVMTHPAPGVDDDAGLGLVLELGSFRLGS